MIGLIGMVFNDAKITILGKSANKTQGKLPPARKSPEAMMVNVNRGSRFLQVTKANKLAWTGKIFFVKDIDKMAIFGLHISKILHENNFWTKKPLFFEGLLNCWLSGCWLDFGKKRASLRKKSQRRRKIWRWLLKIWRAYRNAKSSKIWAKNVHKSVPYVQIFAFCTPFFHRARAGRGVRTAIFHSKMLRRREQKFLWKILTNGRHRS